MRYFNPELRERFSTADLNSVIEALFKKVAYRARQKGNQCFGSDYETIGVLQLEIEEFKAAVQSRLSSEAKFEELLDIAWAALLGAMTLKKGIEHELQRSNSHKSHTTGLS